MRFLDIIPQISVITAMLRALVPTLIAFLIVYIFLLVTFALPIFVLMAPVKTEFSSEHLLVHPHDNTIYASTEEFFKLAARVIYNRFWNLVQYNLDDSRIEVEGVCWNGDENAEGRPITVVENCSDHRHAEFNFVAVALYMIYIIVTHIAWMNTLIAVYCFIRIVFNSIYYGFYFQVE